MAQDPGGSFMSATAEANAFYQEDLPLLLRLSAGLSVEELIELEFSHPRLLSEDRVAALLTCVPSSGGEQADIIRSNLEFLQKIQASLFQQPGQYRLGFGPVERIWDRVKQGEIDIAEGERLASQADIGPEMSPIYVQVLCKYAVNSSSGEDWWDILQLGLLLLAASGSANLAREGQYVRERIAIDFIDISCGSLIRVPDGRVYRKALNVGTSWLGAESVAGNDYFLGAMLHRLGRLHLDPYTLDRRLEDYEQQHAMWLARLEAEYGDELIGVPEEDLRVPEPVDALHRADDYLKEAVKLNEGDSKGKSLRARVQALEFLKALGEPVSEQVFIDLADQALQFLDEGSVQQRLAMQATLVRHGLPGP